MKPLGTPPLSSLVPPGSRLFLGAGAAVPHALVRRLLEEAPRLGDVEVVHSLLPGEAPWCDPQYTDSLSPNAFFLSEGVRAAVREGRADYTPLQLSDLPALFAEGLLPVEVAFVQVSPPDRHGYVSLGVSVDVALAAVRAAHTVVAQVNPRMPRTCGQSFVRVDDIDYFIEEEAPLDTLDPVNLDDCLRQIGAHVGQLIEDGSTLQVGAGRTPDAVLRCLEGRKHLGVHTALLTGGVLDAIGRGLIDNREKSVLPGKTVASFALGTEGLYDFLHNNPHVEMRPAEYVCNAGVIARNRRVVALQTARQVDLSGQVVAESLGGPSGGGAGGDSDFLRGAALSEGGKAVIAMPSLSRDGKASRIVAALEPGAGVSGTRTDVHYVVTEYGIATLRGRSLRERALELVQVAHPKFREELMAGATGGHIVPGWQSTVPKAVEIGGVAQRTVHLKDGAYILRPLSPADLRGLQEFFYSHTQETIQLRYGHSVSRMTRKRAYGLVGVDQEVDLALGLFEAQGPREVLHAVGRYYRDPDGKGAEMAFVVREKKRRVGMAAVLLQTMMEIAKKRGLKELWAQVAMENQPMLALFRRYGATIDPKEVEDHQVVVRLSLGRK